MRNCYSIFILLILSWFITSCEEPVDLDLDETSRLIVTSQFSENKALVVYVTESQLVTSNNSTAFVKNASISVFDDNQFIELLEFVNDDNVPYYSSKDLTPEIGKTYTIQVNVPGHDVVTASNSIPIPVPIENVNFSPDINAGNEGDNYSQVEFSVSVSIQDPVEYENYYHIFFYQQRQAYTINSEGDTLYSAIDTDTEVSIALANDNFEVLESKYHRQSFLISDENFNGNLFTLDFNGNFKYDPSKYVLGDFVIELRTVSREYYKYWDYVNAQSSNNNPLNDLFVLDDNIINGAGVFAGYSSSTSNSKLHN